MGSGLVFVVIVALWVVFLVPYWLRRREHLSGSRQRDRFSAALTVLQRRPRRSRRESPTRQRVLAPPRREGPVLVAGGPPPRRRRGRVLRAALAVLVLLLPVVLALTTVLAAAGLLPWAVPMGLAGGAALLVSALRWRARTAAARRRRRRPGHGRRHEAARPGAWARAGDVRPARPPHRDATTHPPVEVLPSTSAVDPASTLGEPTEEHVEPRAAAAAAAAAVLAPEPEAHAETAGPAGDLATAGWTPVPVPPPTYTLKSDAPRRPPSQTGSPQPTGTTTSDGGQAPAPDAPRPLADLDAVLERRRASA